MVSILAEGCGRDGNHPTVTFSQLDQPTAAWGGYMEGAPTWILENVSTPSVDGAALRCGLTGGAPYSNIHCYRNLPITDLPRTVCFSLLFRYQPQTTYNNQDAASIVQALEFSTSAWWQGERYELALQWQNVGNGAPQWRYWDGQRQWVTAGITDTLDAHRWHTFSLGGEIINGNIHYNRFTIDQREHALNFMVSPVVTPGDIDRLAVAVQLDGNMNTTSYDLFIDAVSLTINGSCPALPTP